MYPTNDYLEFTNPEVHRMNITNQVKKISIVLLSLSALVFGATAMAKPHQGKHDEVQQTMRIIMKKLDLTDDQVTQIKAIKDAQKEQMKVTREEHRATGSDFRDQMSDIFMAEEFDESAFVALKEQISTKKDEVALMKAKALHSVFQVLTAEQKEEFKTIQEERKEKRANKRSKRNSDK